VVVVVVVVVVVCLKVLTKVVVVVVDVVVVGRSTCPVGPRRSESIGVSITHTLLLLLLGSSSSIPHLGWLLQLLAII